MQRFEHISLRSFGEVVEAEKNGYELVLQSSDGIFIMKKPVDAPRQWEYTRAQTIKELDELGQYGWEAIGIYSKHNENIHAYCKTEPVIYLKREI